MFPLNYTILLRGVSARGFMRDPKGSEQRGTSMALKSEALSDLTVLVLKWLETKVKMFLGSTIESNLFFIINAQVIHEKSSIIVRKKMNATMSLYMI